MQLALCDQFLTAVSTPELCTHVATERRPNLQVSVCQGRALALRDADAICFCRHLLVLASAPNSWSCAAIARDARGRANSQTFYATFAHPYSYEAYMIRAAWPDYAPRGHLSLCNQFLTKKSTPALRASIMIGRCARMRTSPLVLLNGVYAFIYK